jgi:hypothetical protein
MTPWNMWLNVETIPSHTVTTGGMEHVGLLAIQSQIFHAGFEVLTTVDMKAISSGI